MFFQCKKIFIIILTLFASLFMGCDDGGNGRINDSSILFNDKIIENDDFFAGSHWNDPHVLHDGTQFVMFASSDISWNGYVQIYRLVSSDGKNWSITNSGNPVFEKAASGWDSHCVETPAVVYYGGQYHMFYTGYDVAYDYTSSDGNGSGDGDTLYDDDTASKHFRIGHATSPDGITWTRDSSNPIVFPTDPYVVPNLDFNQSVVGEPAPVVFNGKIYLYFTAVGASIDVGTTWQTIGLVVYDGTNWDAPRRVLTPDLLIYPRSSGDEYIGYSTPNAAVIDGKVHLFFDVVLNSPWTQVKIHHAVSSDGESGWIQDSGALLQRSDYYWTESEIRSPSVLVYGGNLYLYFAGHYYDGSVPNLSIGLKVYEGTSL